MYIEILIRNSQVKNIRLDGKYELDMQDLVGDACLNDIPYSDCNVYLSDNMFNYYAGADYHTCNEALFTAGPQINACVVKRDSKAMMMFKNFAFRSYVRYISRDI